MRIKNTKRKGAKYENKIKNAYKKSGFPLVVRQARSVFPDLIVFGENIKFVECKTNIIKKSDIERMKRLLQSIVSRNAELGALLVGIIVSPSKVITIEVKTLHCFTVKSKKK